MKIVKILLILILILNTSLLFADIYMKQKTVTSGFSIMGQSQPGEEKIQEIWITDDKIATISETESIIMYNTTNKIVFINHENKSYYDMVMDMESMTAGTEEDMDEEEKTAMKNMMASMGNMEITITPTNETQKIGQWHCKKYIQKMKLFTGPMESVIWASDEIDIDYDQYAKFMTSMMAKMPGMQKAMANYMKELKKMKGVAVKTITNTKIMGQEMKSSTELLEYKKSKAPASIFVIPSGYKKAKMG